MALFTRLAPLALLVLGLYGCGPSTQDKVEPGTSSTTSETAAPPGAEGDGSGTPGLAAPREPSKTMPAGELPLGAVDPTKPAPPDIKTLPGADTTENPGNPNPQSADPETNESEKSEYEQSESETSTPAPQN